MIYSGYRRNCRKNLKKSKKQLTFQKTNAILTKSVRESHKIWDHSSAGRASALQAEGHRFEPYWSHTFSKIGCGGIAQLARAHGSYPWCRWFKSSSRYLCKKRNLQKQISFFCIRNYISYCAKKLWL